MPAKEPKREFKGGDKIRVNLHRGKIEDAVVRAVIQHNDGLKLQVTKRRKRRKGRVRMAKSFHILPGGTGTMGLQKN